MSLPGCIAGSSFLTRASHLWPLAQTRHIEFALTVGFSCCCDRLALSAHTRGRRRQIIKTSVTECRITSVPFVGTNHPLLGINPWESMVFGVDRSLGWRNGKNQSKHDQEASGPIPICNLLRYGPPGFVSGVRTMLTDSGVDDNNVRTEEFGHY